MVNNSRRRATGTLRHLVIGNPANRRIALFQQALARAKLPPAEVLAYADVLRGRRSLDEALLRCRGDQADDSTDRAFVRIESPGEDFEVDRLLLARGADVELPETASRVSAHAARRLRYDRGRIAYPAQWFQGFRSVLAELDSTLARHPGLRHYNKPSEIELAFDKPRCHCRLESAGLPVPAALPRVASFADLRERLRSVGWSRVFVKLASGSSASGVAALYISGRSMRAVTTMELVGSGARTRFYNNLKLRTYDRHRDIERVIDFLCREQAHVEQWLPKASWQGRLFDLRIVVIGGRAAHVVMRTSRSPLTNLHLGNRRGHIEQLRRRLGPGAWRAVMEVAERAAAEAFPHAACLGFDVLLQPGFRRPTILEVNAFGDLLPGVLHKGRSTYEGQVGWASLARSKA